MVIGEDAADLLEPQCHAPAEHKAEQTRKVVILESIEQLIRSESDNNMERSLKSSPHT